jgi:cytochrome c biogenesis protein CcmG, thiol:disulfide interchange protein DsbE
MRVRAWIVELILICICTLATSAAAAPLDVKQWSGRVVYPDFWASWCAPCRQSFPWMQQMKRTYEAQGLTIISINVDQSRADAERFLMRFHPDFDVRFDPAGSLAEQYKVIGMPTGVIFDRHGTMRFENVGFLPVDEQKYEREIRELLAEH